jgi:6-pyruvoyltetrahydropterin/6-carboxytetrahydropterin synthase
MVYLTRKIEFSASHRYHNPAFSPEENARIFGKCNNPNGHGHNYVLEVTVGGETDPATGMVLDLKELKEMLEREVMDRMDHRSLNHEVPELAGQIPTCENVAALIWKLLAPKVRRGALARVRLWESPDLYVDCYGDGGAS